MEQSFSWEAYRFAVKKLPSFCATRKFITAFTTARHLSLSWTKSIQSKPLHLTFSRSNLLFSCHLRLVLPSGLSPLSFHTNTLYAAFPHTCCVSHPSHSSRFYHSSNVCWGVQSINLLLDPNIFINNLFLNPLSQCSSLILFTVNFQKSKIKENGLGALCSMKGREKHTIFWQNKMRKKKHSEDTAVDVQ